MDNLPNLKDKDFIDCLNMSLIKLGLFTNIKVKME